MTNDKFREALTVDFADMDIQSFDELSVLMRRKGYHQKQHGKDAKGRSILYKHEPTNDQLDGAWNYLSSGYTWNEYQHKKPRVVFDDEGEPDIRRVSIKAEGFKKRMIRDRKTGRIVGWERG